MLTPQHFENRIRRFSATRRRILNSELGCLLATRGTLALIVGLILLAGWLPNPFLNLALAAILAIFLIVQAVGFIRGRHHYRSPLAEAFIMEDLMGGLRSRLVSAWDFMQASPTPLTSIVINSAAKDLELDFEAKLDRQLLSTRRHRLVIALVAVVLIGITPWFGLTRTLDNLHHSWLSAREVLFPVDVQITPGPGRHLYEIGESVPIQLTFARPAHQTVTLVLQQSDDDPVRHDLTRLTELTFSYPLQSQVEAEYTAYFEFGNRRTKPMHLVFTTKPELINMQTELVYPGYTRLLPRTLEGIQQRLVGLTGTRISLGFTFSKELQSAEIQWDDGETLPLEVLGRFSSTSLIHNRSRQATLQITDIHGLTLAQPLLIDFELQPDEPPTIKLPRHLKDDMPMLADIATIFGFGIQATDDFGVSRAVLQWQKVSVDNPNQIRESGEVERLISPPRRKSVISFDKVFEGMGFTPGDKVIFWVEAYDNRTPDAQRTRSPRRSFFIYQEELAGLNIKDLGFGGRSLAASRLAKARRSTTVKEPPGQRTAEKVVNEHDAAIDSKVLAPSISGEYRQATRDYFRALSNAVTPSEDDQ